MLTLGNVRRVLERTGSRRPASGARLLVQLLWVVMAAAWFTAANPSAIAQDETAEGDTAAGNTAAAEEPAAEEPEAPKGFTELPGRLSGSMIAMARKGQVSNQDEFENYYTALVAQFTQPAQFPKAYDLRKIIRRDAQNAFNSKTSKQFHAALNQFLLDKLQNYVTDAQYHPAARFNWMLIIGDLNESESLPDGSSQVVPLPAALPVLISVAGDQSQSDSVRLAALIGLDRHASQGTLPDPQRQTLVPILQKLISQRTPPEGRAPEVHVWFQDRARAILGTLGVEVEEPADAPDAADGPDEPSVEDGPSAPADEPDAP